MNFLISYTINFANSKKKKYKLYYIYSHQHNDAIAHTIPNSNCKYAVKGFWSIYLSSALNISYSISKYSIAAFHSL